MKRLAPIAGLLLALTGAAISQQPPGTPPPPVTQTVPSQTLPAVPTGAEADEPGKYVGVATCLFSGCHGSTQPLNASKVLQNEYYTWLNNDRHAKAYNVLFNADSARIVKNMKIKGPPNEATLCLDCHTTNVPARLVSGRIDREDGIQCEACHGPAGGWRGDHTEPGWTHEKSVERGMTDLRHVPTRAQLCLGCHLGNGRKEVDHDLIASGHPILAFELDNFSALMPPHWTMPRDTHGVRAWSVGQVVKFRESLENLARHARGEKWPEFGDMSCFNCHHDLRNSKWRQERGWPGRPGLPSWSPQHWAVMRIIVGKASPSARDQLDGLVAQIGSRVARMNDPQGVATAADNARRIVSDVIPRIDSMRWSDAEIRSLMAAIADDRQFIRDSDVHSAEQVAFSLQSLSSALTRRNPRLLRSPLTRAIDDLFAEVQQDRNSYDPARFANKMQAVRAAL